MRKINVARAGQAIVLMKAKPEFKAMLVMVLVAILLITSTLPQDQAEAGHREYLPEEDRPAIPSPAPETITKEPAGLEQPLEQPPVHHTSNLGLDARLWHTASGQKAGGYCPYVDGDGWRDALRKPIVNGTMGTGFSPGHKAIDININMGAPVFAAAAGVVVWAGDNPFGSHLGVIIASGDGWRVHYIHMGEIWVECGEWVPAGQAIGTVGHSPNKQIHLHLAVKRYGTAYNPCEFGVTCE